MEEVMKYPSYKDSGLKWIGEIPEHWKKTKVGNLYEITLGKMLQPKPRTSNDLLVPYLKAMNIQDGYIDTSNVDEMYSNNTEIEQMSIDKGDLLVCEGGEVARSAIVNSNYEGYIFQNSLHRVRSTNKGMTLYLHYLLNAVRGSGYINILVNKATIAHFTKDKFSSLKICVPPLVEQKAISKYLEIKTAEIDLLISDKEKLIELLEEKRQAIITEAVTKGLYPDVKMKDSGVEWIGEIPEHWDISLLVRNCNRITDGSHFSPESQNNGYPYITVKDIKNGKIDTEGSLKISYEDYEKLTKNGCKPQKNDLLLSKDGTIGRVAIVRDEEVVVLSSLAIITPGDKYFSNFLRFFLESSINVEQMYSYIAGAALKRLTIQTLNKLVSIVPPINEQTEIAEYLEEKIFDIDESIKEISKQIERIKEYRSSLIYEAVTGKIDVRDHI